MMPTMQGCCLLGMDEWFHHEVGGPFLGFVDGDHVVSGAPDLACSYPGMPSGFCWRDTWVRGHILSFLLICKLLKDTNCA